MGVSRKWSSDGRRVVVDLGDDVKKIVNTIITKQQVDNVDLAKLLLVIIDILGDESQGGLDDFIQNDIEKKSIGKRFREFLGLGGVS